MDWIVLGVLLAAVVVWALVRHNSRTAGGYDGHRGGVRNPIDWLG
jgi:hypothetical protein